MTLILDRNTITCKKSLKIPKWKSEAINRWTDNAMTPKEKGQTTIYKTRQYQLLHIIHDVAVWLIQPVFECQPGHVGIKTNQLQYVGIRNPMYVT